MAEQFPPEYKIATARMTRARISPKKLRGVARELVRGHKPNQAGMRYDKAMALLMNHPSKAAVIVRKTLKSAFHNLQQQYRQASEDTVYVLRSHVDGAFILKRIRPRARGRADRIDKRNSHLTIIVQMVE